MSRTGNIPIDIPDGIEVSLKEKNIIIKDKSGEKQFKFSNDLIISIENNQILIKPKELNKKTKHGSSKMGYKKSWWKSYHQ